MIIKAVKNTPRLWKSFDFSNKLQKYSLDSYLKDILYVLKTGIAWRDLKSSINWNSVYKTYCKLVKFKILESCYQNMLNKYLSDSHIKSIKLKYVITDTSFIPNKYGKELIGYNKYYNRKCYKGNKNDSKILEDHLTKINADKSNKINNDHQERYFLADAGYDSKEIKEKIERMKYKPIIARNKRNSKRPNKKMIKKQKNIFKKRLIIENIFKRIKDNRRILNRYDSKIENFIGFIYIAFLKLMC